MASYKSGAASWIICVTAQAEIVRRIFKLCGESGYSLKRSAHTLNFEGVQAPQPQKGRFSRSWCTSSVRHILLNRRCVGKTVWNTKRKVRVPGTSKRVYRPRPESEWTMLDPPHLRIVSDELFAAAGRRFEKVKQLYGRVGNEGKGLIVGPRRYLFSGLLKLSECGGSITRKRSRQERRRPLWVLPSSPARGFGLHEFVAGSTQ